MIECSHGSLLDHGDFVHFVHTLIGKTDPRPLTLAQRWLRYQTGCG